MIVKSLKWYTQVSVSVDLLLQVSLLPGPSDTERKYILESHLYLK